MFILDCLGQRCPLPVIALAKNIGRITVGDTIRVLADDPAAENDIQAWCRMRGQEYIGGSRTNESAPAYDIRRSR